MYKRQKSVWYTHMAVKGGERVRQSCPLPQVPGPNAFKLWDLLRVHTQYEKQPNFAR